jgi:hypothetical protein
MKTPKQSMLLRQKFLLPFFYMLLCPGITTASTHAHRVLAGPEFYNVHRTREGGTKQNGTLIGAKLLYDHVKRYKFYWAAEALYAVGPLSGHTGQNKKIKSCLNESYVEGRFGYTFQYKCGWKPAFTPFAGAGYFWEINKFDKRSPLPIHTKTTYRYITGGFLASVNWNADWQIGLTLKVRYMIDPRCTITHDPEFNKVFLKIGNDDQLQYRIELPINYAAKYAIAHTCVDFSFIPFCEKFCYQRQAAYPFDYLKTRFFNYGATLAASYTF